MHKVWSSENLEQMLEPNDWMRLQEQVRNRAADMSPQPTELKSRLIPFDDIRGVFFDIYGTLLISEAGEITSGQISDEEEQKKDRQIKEKAAKAKALSGESHRASAKSSAKSASKKTLSKSSTGPSAKQLAQEGIKEAARQAAKQADAKANKANKDAALDEEALHALPKLLRASLPQDFRPSALLEQAILGDNKRRKNARLQYPEVDIVSLWHQIFLQQLDEDMQRSFSPFMLARFILEHELLHNRVQLMPGALELLHWLAARNFYVGIISNAQFYTPIILCALLGVQDLAEVNIPPDLRFWSYRYGCSKPQPEIFLASKRALAHYDLEDKEILYVGNDMRNDIYGAAGAGFCSALFAGDKRSLRMRKELNRHVIPHVVITDLGQLKGIL